ncbi:unnamed protein product [Ixodes hexagonus]
MAAKFGFHGHRAYPVCALLLTLFAVPALIVALSVAGSASFNILEVWGWLRQLGLFDVVALHSHLSKVLSLAGLRFARVHDESNVTIISSFRPIDFGSLTKDFSEGIYDPESNLRCLHSWNKPSHKEKNIPLCLFSAFLPPFGQPAGKPWWLIESSGSEHDGRIESALYKPQPGHSHAEVLLHCLFSMFHPNVFLRTRAAPAGTAAVVARKGNGTLDILFRSHIEFQLNEPPRRPFWFSPSQFSGRIVLSEDGSTLHHFNVHVPAERLLNVDLEWLTGSQHDGEEEPMEVDIGHIPEMALTSVGTSPPSNAKWDYEMAMEEARRALDQAFFPFLNVPYHNLTTAAALARQERKMIHSVVLWGNMDDQSC